MRRNEQWYKNIFEKTTSKENTYNTIQHYLKNNWCSGSKKSWKAKGFCSCHCDFILLDAKNYIPIRIVETTYMVITTNIEMIFQSGFHSRKVFYQEVFPRSCWKKQKRCMCYLSLQIVCLKFWLIDVKS